MTELPRATGSIGRSPDRPLPTLDWPDADPPPSWWGIGPNSDLTKVFRSYEDYCHD